MVYTCDICFKTLHNKSNLNRHKSNIHPNKEEMTPNNMEMIATATNDCMVVDDISKKINLSKASKMEASCKSFKCGLCESAYNCKLSLRRHIRIKNKFTVRNEENLIPKVVTNIDTSECNLKFDKVDGGDTNKTNLTSTDEQLNEIKAARNKMCEIDFPFHVDVDCAVVNIIRGLESHVPNTARKVLQT